MENTELADLLQCPICYDNLNDPVLIVSLVPENNCRHRFCRDCLEKLARAKNRKRKCPG